MTIRHLLRSCVCALLVQVASASNVEISPSEAAVKLEGLEASYAFHAPVTVKLTNASHDAVWCGIGVERKVREKWMEFATNIGDREPYAMQFGYTERKALESWNATWNPIHFPAAFEAKSGEYRFVISYRVGKNDYRTFYSEPFRIR